MNGRWIQLKTSSVAGLSSFLPGGRGRQTQAPASQVQPARYGVCQTADAPETRDPASAKVQTDKAAFSLIELMVVLGIIGLLATLGFPMVKALNQTSAVSAASRQLMDDISLARMKAINNRTVVYMVFSPINLTNAYQQLDANRAKLGNDPRPFKQLTNLISGQYSAYALVAARTVGDQPGHLTPKYLTEWRNLPDGVFIAPAKYNYMVLDSWRLMSATNRPFAYATLPFPTANCPLFPLPCLQFNPLGQLVTPTGVPTPDEIIPLTRGSIMFDKDVNGKNIMGKADFREAPPGNATNMYNRVHVFWQTGRAKVEKVEAK